MSTGEDVSYIMQLYMLGIAVDDLEPDSKLNISLKIGWPTKCAHLDVMMSPLETMRCFACVVRATLLSTRRDGRPIVPSKTLR